MGDVIVCECCRGQGDNAVGSECTACDGSGVDPSGVGCKTPCRLPPETKTLEIDAL